jgi:hypothetical protein
MPKCIHCGKYPTPDGHRIVERNETHLAAPVRLMRWREVGTKANERMRAAIWLYRAAPMITLAVLQIKFKTPVKTLMRYVRSSYNINYKKYNLYFGDADTFGETDRSRRLIDKNYEVKHSSTMTYDEMELIRKKSDIPLLAAKYLDIYMFIHLRELS